MHYASKTNSAIVSEVRATLRKKLPEIFEKQMAGDAKEEEEKIAVEVLPEPLIDDFLNVMEIACTVKYDSDADKNMAIGVTFLNNHCFVNDLKPSKLEKGVPSLLKRSVELKLEILEEILGWNILVIDQAEYLDLFN